MTPEEYEHVEALFNAVADLPEAQRATYLDQHVRNIEIRRLIEAMVIAEDEHNGAWSEPEDFGIAPAGPAHAATAIPENIGRYRIIRRIGSGGMGVVYEAEQDAPRRRVALKMMQPQRFSRQMIRRFEIEAHVLGQLHHPGIAQIYESGLAHDDSRGGDVPQPFFAMELIEGEPLKDYVSSRNCSVRERLALMAQVADAVHHAHQKGIVHRDLKPDNILVDEHGQPKVLDFGVARAVDSDVTIATLHTDAGQIIGTLAYMSPEQVAGRPELLDTRSDVYALGAVTYELLTGELPLDVGRETVPSAIRMIQEDEPRRLSRINARLRGDVETIVAKAMEKDKTRRYQSAIEFAADIRRFLNDEPIAARPASAVYQFRKFAKRNKAIVGAAAVVMATLTAATVVATWLAVEAAAASDRAQREANKLGGVNEYVFDMIAAANPANNPLPREMSVVDMLDVAAAKIDSALYEAPEIEAAIRAMIGQAYRELGRLDEAREHLAKALEMQRDVYGERNLEVANTMHMLGSAHIDSGDHAAARPLLEQALATRRVLLGERHGDVAASLAVLGHMHFVEGDYESADRLLREALAMTMEVTPDDYLALAALHEKLGTLAWQRGEAGPAQQEFRAVVEQFEGRADAALHPRYVQALNNLAVVLRFAGELDTAEAMYERTLETAKRIYGEEHPFIATTLNNIGWLYQTRGDLERAVPLVREALEMRRRLLGPEHADVSELMHNLADLLAKTGELDQAVPMMREALAIRRRAIGPRHPDIVPALHTMAELLEADGDRDEPVKLLREAVEIDTASYGAEHPHVAGSLELLAKALWSRGDRVEAEETLRDALRIREAALGVAHKVSVRAYLLLAEWYADDGRHDEAESLLIGLYDRLERADARFRQATAGRLASLYESLRRADEADAWRTRAESQ